MTESTGIGRGGRRSGAGRRRTQEWYEMAVLGARLGDVRLMERADKLRAAADATAPDPDAIERRRRADAARQREKRIRDTLGLRPYRLALPEDELAVFLIDAEVITQEAALDHSEVERALGAYIRKLIVTP
jgi:hypothetical protein